MASTHERRAGAGGHMTTLIDWEKPRAKRTHEEVVAAGAERTAAAEALARQRDEAMALIASLDVELDAARAAEEADAIDDIDDLPSDMMQEERSPTPQKYDEDTPMLEITQEQFARIEDKEAYLSPDQWEPSKGKGKAPAAAASKRTKKPEKYETRRAIEALGKTLATESASATDVVKKKGVQNRNAAAASSKSGLSKSWTTKASTGPSTIGGFTDEDAEAARPDFETPETVRAPRKNNMVGLINLDDDDDDTPSKVPAVARVAHTPRAPIKSEAGTSKISALAVRPRKAPKAVVKSESLSSSYTPFTPQSSADIKGLPAFIGPTWKSVFLPKCYFLLYTSPDPMTFGAVGDDPRDPGRETVDILQGALDELYPGVQWKLKWNDVICSRAVSRMREERGKFAKRGARHADKAFEDPKYYSAKKGDLPRLRLSAAVASDAKYAVRKNGPAFYRDPTPLAVCRLSKTNPAYIKPRGYFQSAAVIYAVSPVIGGRDWSLRVYKDENGQDKVDLSGLPVGALGLAAAGVECGYKLHTTGIRTKPLEFSAVNFGPVVRNWIEGIKDLRASHWQSIIMACGAALAEAAVEEEDEISESEEESLDGVRERMYIPSSSPCHE
ncbi:hypothetical protein C8F04DRAFT_1189400 [Mycena alexandri]|uniref:Uncharacterized protein n=1 Tax=Mycena alexandri TaxID=1745969 RepID=A0AAD6SIP1_9AGAR|nr:hypothetical protein C8F04DRAFT_1189400 [Mycena alexandri]